MSDKDILGKADALLNRHAPGRAAPDPAGVPVLTDLVEAPASPAALTDPVAREVFTRVMAEVEGRFAAELEGRLAKHLMPQVHAAIASAMGGLRQDIAQAIADAVAEALKARNVK